MRPEDHPGRQEPDNGRKPQAGRDEAADQAHGEDHRQLVHQSKLIADARSVLDDVVPDVFDT